MKHLVFALLLLLPMLALAQTRVPWVLHGGGTFQTPAEGEATTRAASYLGVGQIRPANAQRDPEGRNAWRWEAGLGVDVGNGSTVLLPQVAAGSIAEPFYFGGRLLGVFVDGASDVAIRPEAGLQFQLGDRIGFGITIGYSVFAAKPVASPYRDGTTVQVGLLLPL